jgi:hypothetical protein
MAEIGRMHPMTDVRCGIVGFAVFPNRDVGALWLGGSFATLGAVAGFRSCRP